MPTSQDPVKAQRQLENLLPGPSPDPAARERQLANLKVGRPTHGAGSEAAVAPLREQYLAELKREFPTASERRLLLQAGRLAKLELLERFIDEHGVIRRKRTGDVFAAVALAERLAASYSAEHDRLESQQRTPGGTAGEMLESVTAELLATTATATHEP